MRGTRRDGDDGAATGLGHHGQSRVHAVEHTFDVDIDHRAPAFGGDICQWSDGFNDASVVDQDVEAAEFGDGLGDRALHVSIAGHITGQRHGADLFGDGGDPVATAGHHDHIGTPLRHIGEKPPRQCRERRL